MPRESDFYSREEAPRHGSPVMFCLCPLMRLQSLQTVMIAALSQLIPLITGHSLCFSTTCYYQDKWQMKEGGCVCNLRGCECVDNRLFFFWHDWGGPGMKVLVAGSWERCCVSREVIPHLQSVWCRCGKSFWFYFASKLRLSVFSSPHPWHGKKNKTKLNRNSLGYICHRLHVFHYVWCVNFSTFFWEHLKHFDTLAKNGRTWGDKTQHVSSLYFRNIFFVDGLTSVRNWGKFGSVAEEPRSFIWPYVKSLLSLVDKISAPLSNCPVNSSIKDVLMCLMWPRATYQSR